MLIHTMKLSRVPFQMITGGKKTIESRLFDKKRQLINVGDMLEFSLNDDPTDKISTKVKALYRYASFEKLFSDFPAQSFGGESKEQLLEEIHQFYTPDDEQKFGVVGIRIEKVDN